MGGFRQSSKNLKALGEQIQISCLGVSVPRFIRIMIRMVVADHIKIRAHSKCKFNQLTVHGMSTQGGSDQM